MKDNIDIRLTLSSLLIDDDKTDEAATLLSPPKISGIVLIKMFYAANWLLFSVFFYAVVTLLHAPKSPGIVLCCFIN
jgi:hypothetical protein